MSLHLVSLAASTAQPWRNGGGITHELLAWPADAGADWQVRVSVATIAADGPFSPFPGVQRWFKVLEGEGVRLRHRAGQRRCTVSSTPWHFDGADAPQCQLIAGPTRDLNLMLRGSGAMRSAKQQPEMNGRWRWRGLFTTLPVVLHVATTARRLDAGTLAWSDDPASPVWRCDTADGAARADPGTYWLSLD